MVSGAAAGCQADRARRRAFGVGTRGGQSVPAALAAYLNVAFRSMLPLPCGESVGCDVPPILSYCSIVRTRAMFVRYSGPQKVDHSGYLHLLRLFPSQPP